MITDINQRLAEIKERHTAASSPSPKPGATSHFCSECLTSDVPFLLAEIKSRDTVCDSYAVENQRLSDERDAAWKAGRDAAAKVADEYTEHMIDSLNKQRAELQSGTVSACKADAGDHIAVAIRALATSKPE